MRIDKKGRKTVAWDVNSWVWISVEGCRVAKLLFIPRLLRNSVNTPTCGNRGAFFFKPFDRRQRKKVHTLILFLRDDHTGGRGTSKANSTSATWGREAPTCCPAWRPSLLPTNLTSRSPSKRRAVRCLTTARGPLYQTSPSLPP